MTHIEVHSVEAGKAASDLMHAEHGLKSHLKNSRINDPELRVTAIDRTQEHNSDPHPYLRIYYDDTPVLHSMAELIAVIRKYPGMYQYGIQVMPRLERFNPPIRDGHLP